MLHRTLWWALGAGSIAIAIGIAAMLRVRRAWGWGIAAALGGALVAVVATLGESGPSLWTLLGLLPAAAYVALIRRDGGPLGGNKIRGRV
jgi:peptidoglycan/LPS O-acetylase OafA/YrhL